MAEFLYMCYMFVNDGIPNALSTYVTSLARAASSVQTFSASATEHALANTGCLP